jgi:hypothetical protein
LPDRRVQLAAQVIVRIVGQLKRRLRPMRGLQTDRTAQLVIAGHAFLQNLRRGHYELGSPRSKAPDVRVEDYPQPPAPHSEREQHPLEACRCAW